MTSYKSSAKNIGLSPKALCSMDYVYVRLERHYQESHKVVGYRSIYSQRLCYKLSLKLGNLYNTSILDAGCGLGNLYSFIHEKYSSFHYIGIDVSSRMIKKAIQTYPDATFKQQDVLTYQPLKHFDWAFSIGIYNIELGDNDSIMRQIINKLFEITKKGLAVSMTHGEHLPQGTHSFCPEDMCLFAESLTPHINIHKSDKVNGFVLFLYH